MDKFDDFCDYIMSDDFGKVIFGGVIFSYIYIIIQIVRMIIC